MDTSVGNRSEANRSTTRRSVLAALGSVGVGATSGCSSLPLVGGSSGPRDPNVERVSRAQIARNWALDAEGDPHHFSAFSPYEVYDRAGVTYSAIAYKGSQAPPGTEISEAEIPVTFFQWIGANVLRVDQYPEYASRDEVVSSLDGTDGRVVDSKRDFDIISTGGGWTHAVSDDRHVATKGPEATKYLNRSIEGYYENQSELTRASRQLREKLGGIRDTFTIEHRAPKDELIGYFGEDDKSLAGMVTVDLEEGEKYAAWLFPTDDIADTLWREYINSVMDSEIPYRNVSRDGRFWMADGELDLPERKPRNVPMEELEEYDEKLGHHPLATAKLTR